MNTLIESAPMPRHSVNGLRLQSAAPTLWRVVDRTGKVIGHIQAHGEQGGTRYRAQRFSPMARVFRALGDFWSADDAIDCLRFAR